MEMVRNLCRALWSAVFVLGLLASSARAENPSPLTAWMSLSDLNAYLEGLDGDKPEGKNFWDRGHWITAIEGRWEAGIPQYRVSYDAVPEARRAVWWQWYLNQDKQSFDAHVHQLADEGYTLVHGTATPAPAAPSAFRVSGTSSSP